MKWESSIVSAAPTLPPGVPALGLRPGAISTSWPLRALRTALEAAGSVEMPTPARVAIETPTEPRTILSRVGSALNLSFCSVFWRSIHASTCGSLEIALSRSPGDAARAGLGPGFGVAGAGPASSGPGVNGGTPAGGVSPRLRGGGAPGGGAPPRLGGEGRPGERAAAGARDDELPVEAHLDAAVARLRLARLDGGG